MSGAGYFKAGTTMTKTLARRIGRLETRFRPAGQGQHFRIVVSYVGGDAGLRHATCSRSRWPDGTIFELIHLHGDGYCEGEGGSDEAELGAWIDTVPIDGTVREFARRCE